MDSVVKGAVVYLVLLLIFRISGKRTLAQMGTFDLVLMLIISESIQQAMVDEDRSMTNAFLIVMTLVGLDIILARIKLRFPSAERIIEGSPVIIIEDGRPLKERMDNESIDETDIMEAARELQGLSKLDQIRYAVLEKNGQITIVPKEQGVQ